MWINVTVYAYLRELFLLDMDTSERYDKMAYKPHDIDYT